MRIAFIGQKGIPATFGGVEYHVEELASRLAARGHDVTVYVRDWYVPREQSEYRGVKLVHTPTVRTKHLDAFVHSLTSSVHSLFNRYDIIHYHAIGPSFFAWLPRGLGKKVVATIHRFDYDAEKWGRGAHNFLKVCEAVALKVPDKTIVVAKHQREFYQAQSHNVVYVPNGVPLPEVIEPQEIKDRYGLKGQDYILSLGRLVPEKRIDWLIDSYLESNPEGAKLVIAGGSSATDDYVEELQRRAGGNPNIIFTGYVTGRLKAELFSNACLFVIPSSIEGLPIALLEAMSYKLLCLASDIPPHLEVINQSQNGFLFDKNDRDCLTQAISNMVSLDKTFLLSVGEIARDFVGRNYDWNNVVDKIEGIYYGLLSGKRVSSTTYRKTKKLPEVR